MMTTVKKAIVFLQRLIVTFFMDCRFSLKLAWFRMNATLLGRLHLHRQAHWFQNRKDQWILAYLEGKYSDAFSIPSTPPVPIPNAPVWICWLSGLETAPPLVKVCVESIYRNSNGHPVHLITAQNYSKYVTLPDYILAKFEAGNIGMAHFSDILRVSLLANHGGLWLDATIFCAKPLPEPYFQQPLFTCRSEPHDIGCVSMDQWTTFCLGGWKGSSLFLALQSFFFLYWKEESYAVDYLFFDSAILLSRDLTPGVQGQLNDVPLNNLHRNDLILRFADPWEYGCLEDLLASDTVLFKLGYREPHFLAERTVNGKMTVYSAFIQRLF